METCCGCGENLSTQTQFVAVLKEGDQFVSKPVCDLCHQDPAHRTVTLKAHFFPRRKAEAATAAAGSSSGIAAE
jgi:hypothetical protein